VLFTSQKKEGTIKENGGKRKTRRRKNLLSIGKEKMDSSQKRKKTHPGRSGLGKKEMARRHRGGGKKRRSTHFLQRERRGEKYRKEVKGENAPSRAEGGSYFLERWRKKRRRGIGEEILGKKGKRRAHLLASHHDRKRSSFSRREKGKD